MLNNGQQSFPKKELLVKAFHSVSIFLDMSYVKFFALINEKTDLNSLYL